MEPCYLHMGGRLQVFRGHPPNPRTHQYWAQLDTQPIEWWNRSSSGNKAVGKPGPSIPPDTFFPSERTMGCFVNSPLCSIPIPVRFHSWWISFFFSLFRRHARRFSGTNLDAAPWTKRPSVTKRRLRLTLNKYRHVARSVWKKTW